MSAQDTKPEAAGQPAHAESHDHPGEGVYIKIALFLAVVTGVEVALSYVEIAGSQLLTNTGLILLGVVKFALVVMYFMHLKFDNRILRRLFVAGLITAIAVYIVYLLTLGIFLG